MIFYNKWLNMLNYTDELLSSKELHIKIAARLHALRTSARLSLQALADLTGYTKPTVQSWEKGWRDQSGENRIPTLEQLLDLSSVYNCTPEYLLCEYDLPTKQVTDTCRETGLLPENAVQLRNMMASFSSPNLGGANDLFLAFLNHYLSNITLINELIFNRQTLEFSRIAFEEDPYHDILLEGYNAVVNQIE
ncbi:MAG: helix-turn-helix transcriptional regulator, partial [Butyrivibrio sp.]|nr:helix-turn-helix transcriptional regulator [Butyrivibrio sp.]